MFVTDENRETVAQKLASLATEMIKEDRDWEAVYDMLINGQKGYNDCTNEELEAELSDLHDGDKEMMRIFIEGH